jgi:hypothetical protein
MIWTKTSLKLKAEVIYQERMAIAGRFLGGRPLCRRFLVEASRKVRGRESPQRHRGHEAKKRQGKLGASDFGNPVDGLSALHNPFHGLAHWKTSS